MNKVEAYHVFNNHGINIFKVNADELKNKYRDLLKANHPDLHLDEADKYNKTAQELNDAYGALKLWRTNKDKAKYTFNKIKPRTNREKWFVHSYDGINLESTHITGAKPSIFIPIAIFWATRRNSTAVFIQNANYENNILHLIRLHNLNILPYIKFDFVGGDPAKDYQFLSNLPQRLDKIYQEILK